MPLTQEHPDTGGRIDLRQNSDRQRIGVRSFTRCEEPPGRADLGSDDWALVPAGCVEKRDDYDLAPQVVHPDRRAAIALKREFRGTDARRRLASFIRSRGRIRGMR